MLRNRLYFSCCSNDSLPMTKLKSLSIFHKQQHLFEHASNNSSLSQSPRLFMQVDLNCKRNTLNEKEIEIHRPFNICGNNGGNKYIMIQRTLYDKLLTQMTMVTTIIIGGSFLKQSIHFVSESCEQNKPQKTHNLDEKCFFPNGGAMSTNKSLCIACYTVSFIFIFQ